MSFHCLSCGEDFKEEDDLIPKVLKCGDTLCLKCIKKNYEVDKITCPLCHKEIEQKTEDIPINKYIIYIKKSILCDLCLEENSNSINGEKAPKILKCGHTFCLQCLYKLNKNGKIRCPFCGSDSTEDINNIPVNLFIIDRIKHELYTNVNYLINKSIDLKEPYYHFSLGLMGETMGGKTSITHYFYTGKPAESTNITLGSDYHYKYILINKKLVKISFWDTPGQERFGSLSAGALRCVHGLLLVFSLSCELFGDNYKKWKYSKGEEKEKLEEEITQKKFKTLEFWLDQFCQFNKLEKRIIYLIGNKIDDIDNRIIKKKDAKNFAKDHGFKYFETSAKTGENIFNVFENIIFDLIKLYPDKIKKKGMNLQPLNIKRKSCF